MVDQESAEKINQPPSAAGNTSSDEDVSQVIPIIELVNYVYGMADEHIPPLGGFEIAFDIVTQQAFGATMCP